MATLAHLRLREFRNYKLLDLDVPEGVCILRGGNGQGKTNLLEAVYFLDLLRSFRTRSLRNLCNWDASAFFVGGVLRDSPRTRLAVRWSPERRMLRADGKRVARASDFIGRLKCVVLAPEDVEIIRGSASERRRLLDIVLSQADPFYLGHLRDYRKIVRLRNEVLRNPGKYRESLLKAYDAALCEAGAEVLARRSLCIRRLNEHLQEIWACLSCNEWGALRLDYYSTVMVGLRDADAVGIREHFAARLAEVRTRDEREGGTTIGPHRDDVRIILNDRLLPSFGSEGQCRTAAIALKLASAAFVDETSASGMVLLVDDVFGELDERRRKAVLKRVTRAAQTFVVCATDIDLSDASVVTEFQVKAGQVTSVA